MTAAQEGKRFFKMPQLPERHGQVAMSLGVRGGEVEGPAVGGDGPRQVAGGLERTAEVGVRRSEFRVELEGRTVGGDGPLQVFLLVQSVAEVEVSRGRTGVELEGRTEGGERPLEVLL